MNLVCSKTGCGTINNYSESVILGLFINGLHDMELHQDLLAEQEMQFFAGARLGVRRELQH